MHGSIEYDRSKSKSRGKHTLAAQKSKNVELMKASDDAGKSTVIVTAGI